MIPARLSHRVLDNVESASTVGQLSMTMPTCRGDSYLICMPFKSLLSFVSIAVLHNVGKAAAVSQTRWIDIRAASLMVYTTKKLTCAKCRWKPYLTDTSGIRSFFFALASSFFQQYFFHQQAASFHRRLR